MRVNPPGPGSKRWHSRAAQCMKDYSSQVKQFPVVFEEEHVLDNVQKVGVFILKKLCRMKEKHTIIGDVRAKGLLLEIDLVGNKDDNEPFVDAGNMVYERAFKKGAARVPAGNILRLAPPLIMKQEPAAKLLEIIEESIFETEKHFGYRPINKLNESVPDYQRLRIDLS